MSFQPDQITRKHVEDAVELIERKQIPLIPSTGYDVFVNEKAYPPKEVMRYAHEQMNGKHIWYPGGGEATNKFLRALGFEVRPKGDYSNLISQYKIRIKENGNADEVYKWELLQKFQGRPQIHTPDFYEELKSIDYRNLVYPIGLGVLYHMAKERTQQLQDCFSRLFDEETELSQRIKNFNAETLRIYRELVPDKKLGHHQDERSMATYLTFFNPNKYPLYKDSFYRKYCKLVGIPIKSRGDKYVHYIELLNGFIEGYIVPDEELMQLKRSFLPPGGFADENNLVLAQDILYQVLDKSPGSDISYWRIGTSDDEDNYWEEMKEGKHMSIGWSGLGDLSLKKITSKDDIYELLERFYPNDNRTRSRKAGEIFNFYQNVKEGDIVLAQRGDKILGVGKVTDDYEYKPGCIFGHTRPVQWLIKDPEEAYGSEGRNTSVYKLSYPYTIENIKSLLSLKSKYMASQSVSKNIILYGPPGTGKTYNTIELAVELATGEAADTHKENKAEFDRLRKEGQVEFVTFHQNYGYEDLVIGIKPDLDENDLKFRRSEGIFYRICKKAEKNFNDSRSKVSTQRPFDDVMNEFLEPLIKHGNEIEVKMISGKTSFWINDVGPSNLGFRKNTGAQDHRLSLHTLRELYEGKNTFTSGLRYYYQPVTEQLLQLGKQNLRQVDLKNYVLVIDEINRANISKVFGELITLLEEDKRIGGDNELRVTLPNGEKDFGIPPNLFIVGTMNTADKSIALVDIALRRRFEFRGFYPTHEVINKIVQDGKINPDAADLLKHINQAIYQKKGADFLIGHAYFIGKLKESELREVIERKVIPLLLEYFSGKVKMVEEIFSGSNYTVAYDEANYRWNINNAS